MSTLTTDLLQLLPLPCPAELLTNELAGLELTYSEALTRRAVHEAIKSGKASQLSRILKELSDIAAIKTEGVNEGREDIGEALRLFLIDKLGDREGESFLAEFVQYVQDNWPA